MNGAWGTTRRVRDIFFLHVSVQASTSFWFAADDLAQFHRSYTLRGANQYSDEEGEQQQCDEQQLDNFYQRYGSAIGRNVGNSAENEEDEEEWENEQFNGEWDESDEEQYQSEWENTGSSQENNNNKRKGAQKHAGSQGWGREGNRTIRGARECNSSGISPLQNR